MLRACFAALRDAAALSRRARLDLARAQHATQLVDTWTKRLASVQVTAAALFADAARPVVAFLAWRDAWAVSRRARLDMARAQDATQLVDTWAKRVANVQVTESARPCTYYFGKQAQNTCSFWLSMC